MVDSPFNENLLLFQRSRVYLLFTRFFKQKKIDQTKNLAIRQVLSVTKPKRFPTWKQWEQLPTILTKNEKKIFVSSLSIFFLSSFFLLGVYFYAHRIEIPTTGGTYTEALVGSPRFVNPLYASTNNVDADLTALLYSGLLKWNPETGYTNDLADSMQVSEDQTQYTFHLRTNAVFSNGDPVQARDVVFTYTAIQNPVYRSPLLAYFQEVKIEQIDDQTVSFKLKLASPTFIQHLTIGILPGSLWSDIMAQNAPLASLNLQPVGSGPYLFQEFSKDKKGSIRSYTLKRNTRYYHEPPKIDQLIFKFYPDNESALQALINKNVEGIGHVSYAHRAAVENNHNVQTIFASIPRKTTLFFNLQHPVLKNPIVRLALTKSLDKETIVKTVLSDHATVHYGPLLQTFTGFDPSFKPNTFDPSSAITDLETAGFLKPEGALWRHLPVKPRPKPVEVVVKSSKKKKAIKTITEVETPVEIPPEDLAFTLTTVSSDEFVRVADEIKNALEKIGIQITIKTVEAERLMTDVIDPQAFDLLLSADDAQTETDPYLFWHSSQITKGGLNINHYQNKDIDALLEKARVTQNETDRAVLYRQFEDLLVKDVPAVFLYQSTYSYAVAKKIHMTHPTKIRIPSDRFMQVADWYVLTKKVLK